MFKAKFEVCFGFGFLSFSSNPLSYAVSLVSFGLRERPTVFKPVNIEREFFQERNLLMRARCKSGNLGV